MSMHTKVSGTHQEIEDVQAKVSGTWQRITDAWVKVAGNWQQFYDFASYLGVLTVGKNSSSSEYGFVWANASSPYGSLSPAFMVGREVGVLAWFSSNSSLSLRFFNETNDLAFDYLEVNGSKFYKADVDLNTTQGGINRRYDWNGVTNPFGTTVGAQRQVRLVQ